MATVRSISELQEKIKDAINKALENEVSNVVKHNMQDAIQTQVYAAYSPKEYERRGENGGLGDISYMKSELIEDGVLSTTTNAPSRPSIISGEVSDMLGHWVNYGEVSTILGVGPWVFPRDFISATVENLSGNKEHVNALREGLNKQGIRAV